jgi:lipopolysaccharide export system protein LptC
MIMVAVAITMTMIFWNPFRSAGIEITSAGTSLKGTRISMEKPVLSGVRLDGRPYELRASSGVQDIRTPGIIELEQIDARVTMPDQGQMHIIAPGGIYDSKKDTMVFGTEVLITGASGYDIHLRQAFMNFKAGTVVSDAPVDVRGKSMSISAEKLDMTDNGSVITFSGNVTSTLLPTASSGQDQNRPDQQGRAP